MNRFIVFFSAGITCTVAGVALHSQEIKTAAYLVQILGLGLIVYAAINQASKSRDKSDNKGSQP